MGRAILNRARPAKSNNKGKDEARRTADRLAREAREAQAPPLAPGEHRCIGCKGSCDCGDPADCYMCNHVCWKKS